MEMCLFAARVGIFASVVNMIKVLFPNCTLTWRASNYVSCQEKVINRRNGSTIIINFIIVAIDTFIFQLTVFD